MASRVGALEKRRGQAAPSTAFRSESPRLALDRLGGGFGNRFISEIFSDQ